MAEPTITIEGLTQVVSVFALIAILIERSLYQVFDTKLYRRLERALDSAFGGDYMDLKPWVSSALCVFLAFQLDLDMIAMAVGLTAQAPVGYILTGLFLAGGSTGAFKMFKRIRDMKDAKAKFSGIKAVKDIRS